MRYSFVSLAILLSTVNIASALPAPAPQGTLGGVVRVNIPANIPTIPVSRENIEARSPQGSLLEPGRVVIPESAPVNRVVARSPQGTIEEPIRDNLPVDLPGFQLTREELVERSAEPQGQFAGKPIRKVLPTNGGFPVDRVIIDARSAEPQGQFAGKPIRKVLPTDGGFPVIRTNINARSAEPQGQLGGIIRTNIAIPSGLPVSRANLAARNAQGELFPTRIEIPTGLPTASAPTVTRTNIIENRAAEAQGSFAGAPIRSNIKEIPGFPVIRTSFATPSSTITITLPIETLTVYKRQGSIVIPTPSPTVTVTTTKTEKPTFTITVTKFPTTTVTASPVRPTLTVPARRAIEEDIAIIRTVTIEAAPKTTTITASGSGPKVPTLTVPSQ